MIKLASLLSGLAAASLALAGCGGSTADDTADATLTVHNDSDYDITQLYLTLSTSSGWGPDLLHGVALQPDDEITLAVQCATYDAKFVDESGVSCEADSLDLCLNDSVWTINNNTCAFSNFHKSAKRTGDHAQPTAAQK